jgi:FMN phosphatase YigB (HAD superfamily)
MKPKAIIFDMDGTLVDVSSLRDYVTGKKKDFDAFHRLSVDCPPIYPILNAAVHLKAAGYWVLQVTARSEKYRPHTSWWLAEHKVPSDALYMRPDHDHRPDHEVKRDIIDRILSRYDIVHAYDDNPSIIKLWGEYAIPCTVVPGWEI